MNPNLKLYRSTAENKLPATTNIQHCTKAPTFFQVLEAQERICSSTRLRALNLASFLTSLELAVDTDGSAVT